LGLSGISVLFAVLGLGKDNLAKLIQENFKDVENNIAFTNEVYDYFLERSNKRFTL